MTNDAFALSVLRIAIANDCVDHIFWSFDEEGHITAAINCNDLFRFASADQEAITQENVERWQRALMDMSRQGGFAGIYGCAYFACRERKQRPQKKYYRCIEERAVTALFDTCGPVETQA